MLLLLAAVATTTMTALALSTPTPSAAIIETDTAGGASPNTQGPTYLPLVDSTAGNASAYFDPSNGVCEDLGSAYSTTVAMDNTSNATVSMRYGTKKLVLDMNDMCTEAFNLTDCTQGLGLPFESMIKVGLGVIADNATPSANATSSANIAQILSNEFVVNEPISTSGLPGGNSDDGILSTVFTSMVSVPLSKVNGSINIVSYSGNGTSVSAHFIPAQQNGGKKVQGVRVTLDAKQPVSIDSGDLVLRNVGQVVSDMWTASVDGESIAVVFGYINFGANQVVEFVVEPMQYGFNTKMIPMDYCGPVYIPSSNASSYPMPSPPMNFVAFNTTFNSSTPSSASASAPASSSSSSSSSTATSGAHRTSFSAFTLALLFFWII